MAARTSYQSPSGSVQTLTIRLDKGLYRSLQTVADVTGQSQNLLINRALEDYLGRPEVIGRLTGARDEYQQRIDAAIDALGGARDKDS